MLRLPLDTKAGLDEGFYAAFSAVPERYFSAPGRTELGGNHTDHQRGRVLAAAVELDARAAAARNGKDCIRLYSQGFPACQVRLSELSPKPEEIGTTAALVRGVAAGFAQMGCPMEGLDIFVTSTVLPGSGLSSSAAFEVLLSTVLDGFFCGGQTPAPRLAAIGQYAENVYFGKPCGLMDQMASAVGGLVTIDFSKEDAPEVRRVECDLSALGCALCIIDTGGSHAELTAEYAAIPAELKSICACFGKEVLSQVPEEDFYQRLPQLRESCGDRAVLRAMHFYQENQRVALQAAALEQGDSQAFLQLVRESGSSSWRLLQNITPCGASARQEMAVTLALCEKLLQGEGACRVHGGGFAGTVQAFVPWRRLEEFRRGIQAVLGENSCHVLALRAQGGTEMTDKEDLE